MKLVSIGKGGKVGDLKVNRNIIVTEDLSRIDSLVDIQENGEVVRLDAEGNEVHTPESYAIKINASRREIFDELEEEISKLRNEITQAKLNNKLNELKSLPATIDGQWNFRKSLEKLKDFALDLGAKVVAEIAMKQLGY
ncbi:hypothetical protein [Acinetobacter towneri]|uniref:hypothetical protein n=1 Tax=Acinetobacter towneri TaxID=202956 RepID=UPI002097EDE2|nr:hypothetical protein [Acinetobacter towneri]MCO8058039.1 hypothetical protein [Acinetobacter towneri]MCO8063685.1 hypothetical protein [Acinetobacter towneri]